MNRESGALACHREAEKIRFLTSTLKSPIWNPVKPSLTVSTSPPVEATIGTCCEVTQKINDQLKQRIIYQVRS